MVVQHFMRREYSPEKVLEERFHINTGFHAGQREIIELLIQNKRVFAIQHTGWGKSLCYQMASLYHPHLTIVFSPLKALMRDQCQRCNSVYAIPSAIVSSDFSERENRDVLEQAIAGRLKILFISPERLDNSDWQTAVSRMRISMIVIDEAHCISTWGHDFRPHYRRISTLLRILPTTLSVLALTATANKRVEEDVAQQIGVGVRVIRGTMQRPNLYLNSVMLHGDEEKLAYLAEVVSRFPGTGIVYTATQHSAEMVATFLRQQGIDADYYHAGREDETRQLIEQKLMHNQCKVICSTNALGMGIDKQDVRFVVHYHLPASPIHYYQEMGRAGRDGNIAYCVLLHDPADATIQEHFIRTSKPDSKAYEHVLALLQITPKNRDDLMRITGLTQTAIKTILVDLEEQHSIKCNYRDRSYIAIRQMASIDVADYDTIREQKVHELAAMQQYAQGQSCFMGYLTSYLGDSTSYRCGVCGRCQERNFPLVKPSLRIQGVAAHFLGEEFLPRIEKRGTERRPIYETGWALSYHGTTRIGKLVRASKYEGAGPFSLALVQRAVEVLRTRYPIDAINGIVSVPPTKSGVLVEDFARQIAYHLQKEYLPVLTKIHSTQEQKLLTNWIQKSENVKGAFAVRSPEQVWGRTLLLIDDIYDSGYMLREVARTLLQAGTQVIYPFTITRTAHSDDQ